MAESTTVEPVQRSMTFDLLPPTPEIKQQTVASIKRYRAACAKLYATLLLAQQAGATITEHEDGVRVTPDNDRAKLLLAEALGAAVNTRGDKVRGQGQSWVVNVGLVLGYEMRQWFFDELYPEARAFVWDAARRDMETVWKSKDPEFPKASRGWLALQLARQPAKFWRRGIGFPLLTARPQLHEHKLTLGWDKTMGEVTFGLPRLDGGRYRVWRALRDQDEGWKIGTIYLTERDGLLCAVISHHRPPRSEDLDPARTIRVSFDPDDVENYIKIVGPDGAASRDSISGVEVRAWLLQMEARKKALERRRAACGNPRRPWGHRKAWRATQDVLSAHTKQRDLGQIDRNHAWTRRIATRAKSWRCGRLEVINLPRVVVEENGGDVEKSQLFGLPWSWTQFLSNLRYKYEEMGGELILPE